MRKRPRWTESAGYAAAQSKRVFNIDIETCEACGGHEKIIACIEDPHVIQRILEYLDHRATPPRTGNLARILHK